MSFILCEAFFECCRTTLNSGCAIALVIVVVVAVAVVVVVAVIVEVPEIESWDSMKGNDKLRLLLTIEQAVGGRLAIFFSFCSTPTLALLREYLLRPWHCLVLVSVGLL